MVGVDQPDAVRPHEPDAVLGAEPGERFFALRALGAHLLEARRDDDCRTGPGGHGALDGVLHARRRHGDHRQVHAAAVVLQVAEAPEALDLVGFRIDRDYGAFEAAVEEVLEQLIAELARRGRRSDDRHGGGGKQRRERVRPAHGGDGSTRSAIGPPAREAGSASLEGRDRRADPGSRAGGTHSTPA